MNDAAMPRSDAAVRGGPPSPGGAPWKPGMPVTPKDVIWRDGIAQLYRFRPTEGAPRDGKALPVLLVPSIINRWYVLDLRPTASLAGALVKAGLDVYCLDWGAPEDEDRFLSWDDLQARLGRAVRKTLRDAGGKRLSLLGYCMGATLASIYAALHNDEVGGFVNLAGPIDFSQGGFLAQMTDKRWFDPDAIASAGNMGAAQMQAGFAALRPTLNIAKWVGWLDRAHLAEARESFDALEGWSSDNISFPAAAYATYIRELYQDNRLVRGEHFVAGQRVTLESITCPLLTVVAEKDTICPPPAAKALNERSRSGDAQVLTVPGGHVGAVVGGKAATLLYPALARWFAARTRPALRSAKSQP